MARKAVCLPIRSDNDIVRVRQEGRSLAERIGFCGTDLAVIAAAISEVARNIVEYAEAGEIELRAVRQRGDRGIKVIARDSGPGIVNVDLAMQDGYSTASGLGLGLPGARRLMDEFKLVSQVGQGTTVSMHKWLR